MNNNKNTLSLLGALSSKICHDVVAPVSAIDMGLSLLEENIPPAIKQDPSYVLLKDSVQKTLNKINFFRYAFAFGKNESPAKKEEFETQCTNACAHHNLKFSLNEFNLNPHDTIIRLRVIACILYIILECLPKGGKIELEISPTTTTFHASGPMLIPGNNLEKIMNQQVEGLKTQNLLPTLIIECLNYLNLNLHTQQKTANELLVIVNNN